MTLCWVMLGYLFYLDTKQNHAKPMIKHLNILKVEGMFQTTHSFDDFDPRILPGSKNRSCRYRQLCSNETGATCALRHYDAICTPVIVAGRALGLMNVGKKKLGFSMKPASFFFSVLSIEQLDLAKIMPPMELWSQLGVGGCKSDCEWETGRDKCKRHRCTVPCGFWVVYS